MIQAAMTIEQFIEQRFEMPEGGQWTELEAGSPFHLEPPDLDHGNSLLNLSKFLSSYVHQAEVGYPCFDIGLVMQRRPDSLWFPAVSYFTGGRRFEETDKAFTDTCPVFIVEMLSTPLRRRGFDARTLRYLDRGTTIVWGVDPRNRTVEVRQSGGLRHVAGPGEAVSVSPLAGLAIEVDKLFTEPEWYSRPAAPPSPEET